MSRQDSWQPFTSLPDYTARLSAALLNHLPPGWKGRVLEVGCASGHCIFHLADLLPDSEFIGVDISDANINAARRRLAVSPHRARIRFEHADYRQWQDGKFDLIYSWCVLHFIPGSSAALFAKLTADLKDSGLLFYTLPYVCLFNHTLSAVRKVCRATRFLGLDPVFFALARLICRGQVSEERLRERIEYMYLPAHHADGPALRKHLRELHLAEVAREAQPHASAAALKLRFFVLRKSDSNRGPNMNKIEKLESILLPRDTAAPPRADYVGEEKKSYDPQRLGQRFPRLYGLIKTLIGPTVSGQPWHAHVPDVTEHVVLNLGAGTTNLHPHMLNVDFVGFPNIDIVADLADPLPIRSQSVDAVVSISVFEHLQNPARVAAEVARILKPGGIFYLATPFQYPFHGAPRDFTRWTLPGLSNLLGPQFEIIASGSRGGPMGVIILALAHAVAQVACFGSAFGYSLVNYSMLGLLSPLKYLDLIFARLPFSTVLCTAYHLTARKRRAAPGYTETTKAA